MNTLNCIDCTDEIAKRIGGHRLCTSCHRERYGFKAYAKRKQRAAEATERRCSRCTKTKSAKHFYASSTYCKPCIKAYKDSRAAPKTHQIYLIECAVTKLVKIGYTASGADKRIIDLQVGSATELRLLDALPGTRAVEKRVHRSYNAQRVRGEWFKLSAKDLRDVKAMIAAAAGAKAGKASQRSSRPATAQVADPARR